MISTITVMIPNQINMELTEKEQHIGFARKQSGDKDARSVDAIPFHSGAEARREGMRRQGKRRKSSPEA
jgi:hypothetical protein